MISTRSWFQRPITALCLITGLVVLSLYVILASGGRSEEGEDIGFRISFRHYGIDAREMERSAAIPLEDALAAIPGISRIMSASENGQTRVYVNFRKRRGKFSDEKDEYYEAVRDAAQRVYETLPSSAQRPELSSSSDALAPFWTAAVFAASSEGADPSRGGAPLRGVSFSEELPNGDLLERIVKPALSALEGVGDVEISGAGLKEIIITPDKEKCAALDLSLENISSALAADDALFSGGFIHYGGREIPLKVDGRYPDLESLEEALIPLHSEDASLGGAVKLGDIALIREVRREADALSRLNGKTTAVISVSAASGVDRGLLSARIKKAVEKFSPLPLEFMVLEDRGEEEAKAFKSVFAAALQAALLVAAAVILLGTGKSSSSRNGVVSAGAIPVTLVLSAALLACMGFPLNRKFLAGLAVGIGAAADAVILGAEGFKRALSSPGNNSDGKSILKGILPPLISGAATTAAALLPLIGLSSSEDITGLAAALGTVTLVSAALSLSLLPPLFFWANSAPRPGLGLFRGRKRAARTEPLKKIQRRFFRFIALLSGFSLRRPLVFPVFSLFISAAALLSLALAGTDTAGEWAEDSVYFRVEFDGGFLKRKGDALLAAWAAEIKNHPAVKAVQTGARTGSGYGLVSFDPHKADSVEMRKLIRSETIPGAFIYIPEASADDRIWTVSVSGDDSDKCRELAKEAASLCSEGFYSGISFVKEAVLNFKEGGPRLTLIPRREILALGAIGFSRAADTVRRGVHGPVAYKRTESGGEIDVRIKFSPADASGDALSAEELLRIPLRLDADSGTVYLASIMDAEKDREVSVIHRENRRRTASFSLRTVPGDPRFFRDKIMEALGQMELPPGYKIEFDPEAVREAEALSGKLLGFVWVILFCYMIIAAAEESFTIPLVVLASVPPSIAAPVLLFTVSGIPVNTAVACALVSVSGITVNASVISSNELRRQGSAKSSCIYRAARKVIPSLLATSGTTIAGALPFLFLREGNNALLRTLALVTVIGVGVSFFCSLTLVPALMNLFTAKSLPLRVRRNSFQQKEYFDDK